jgi:flavin-dependent dehydrogenase
VERRGAGIAGLAAARSIDDAGLPFVWQAGAPLVEKPVHSTMIEIGWDQCPGPSGRSVLILM